MDFTEENYTNDEEEMEKTCRTLWVGNLHPKVTCDLIAELFYQVTKIYKFLYYNYFILCFGYKGRAD